MPLIARPSSGQRHRLFPALASTLLLFAASPGQWSFSPLAWIALVPFLLACRGLSGKNAAKVGLAAGTVYYLALIYWIIIALGRYGGLPIWLTGPALIALALYMALSTAGFAAIAAWSFGKRLPLVWTAPLAWVSFDFIRGWLFSGFPWLDLGYSQYAFTPVNQIADLTGHSGITFLIVMVNALAAELLPWGSDRYRHGMFASNRRRFRKSATRIVLPVLILAAACGYGLWRQQELTAALGQAPALSLGLIQGNVDQSEKWLPELQEKTVNTYLSLSAEAATKEPLGLLIWPETALPFFPENHPLFQRVVDSATVPGKPSLLTGAPHVEVHPDTNRTEYFNSAFLITASGDGQATTQQRYDKEHLVPFGEYIPLQRYLPTALPLVETMGNFSAGTDAAPLIDHNARLGVLICFESIFPELARIRTLLGANILVNLTNDAWYGRSSAPYQQVPMAVLRAIENRRSLARSANTGISCLIDPLGRVLGATPIFETRFLNGRLPLWGEISFYSKAGYLFPNLCLLGLSLMLLYGILRRDGV